MMKGSNRPKPLSAYPPEWREGMLAALASPDTWQPLARGIPKSNLRTKQNWLAGLKLGLREFPVESPGLTKAALEGRIQARTVADGAWFGIDVLVKASPRRPSDIAREYLEGLAQGKRSPPTPD